MTQIMTREYESVNPSNGKTLKTFNVLTDKQLEAAIATAATYFEAWKKNHLRNGQPSWQKPLLFCTSVRTNSPVWRRLRWASVSMRPAGKWSLAQISSRTMPGTPKHSWRPWSFIQPSEKLIWRAVHSAPCRFDEGRIFYGSLS